ncbi:LOW QUALITY PROTEIN: 2OG-FeII_Oxy domain-containing protein/DIOX_N domain-containing protein, partial [Cephalotus follicularis]
YDRVKEVKQFDDSKLGVKGLVDSGLTTIPRFFVHPPETLTDLRRSSRPDPNIIPLDLSVPRSKAVDQISRASRELGFFQIVNHGIPLGVLERTIGSIKAFHEQPTEIKARFYRREGLASGVSFICNFDLFQSKAASWRDTLQVRLGPTLADLEEIPEICRNEVVEWDSRIKPLGDLLMGLLCEGLGLNTGRLKDMTCLEGRLMVGHYYPYCPQPDLTIGATCHTDPGVFTILLQDHIGGLQVKYGEEWVDVKPVPGAIVINIADVLQIMSNDEYKSVEHRVLANPSQEPRISIVVFLTQQRGKRYGPLPELTSPEKPAIYRQFPYTDYMTRFFAKGLDG